MRKFIILIFLIAIPLFLLSQNISIKSFRLLDNDLDALVKYPEIDRSNGEKAALIKIVTTETGFEFGGGQLGIVKVIQKTAEIWVYVPAKLKAITIAHPKLGQLTNRFYNFDIPIVSGKVYEMVLVTGTIETIVKPTEIATQWLNITSKPLGANVFIQDQLVGTTPFTRKYPEGEYSYRIELPKYHSQAGKVSLAGEKKVLEFVLKPHFGSLNITSTPESGMLIYLNDENTGKFTPATLEGIASGEHTVKLMNQWYQPQSKRVTVTDEQNTTTDFEMSPAYSDITVTTNPEADILIDDKKVGSSTYTSRMLAGIYTIKANKDKHYPDERQVTVVAGVKQTISLSLKPKTGTLDVASTPFDATITLNGKEYGTTSNTIKNLLIGDYSLTLKKIGYGILTKTITIKENSTTEVNETLPSGMEVTITSKPSGAQLTLDGIFRGPTPFTTNLSLGNHLVRLVRNDIIIVESISVTQGGKANFEYIVSEGFDDVTEGVVDADGNKYKTIKLGNQEWMAENLKTTKYRDGSPIPNITDKVSWTQQTKGAYNWFDNNISNKNTYGALYNCYAVLDSKSLCPSGWHVPSDAEWTTLSNYLGGEDVAGGKMKTTTLWRNSNAGASNSSGFAAFPGGLRNEVGDFSDFGYFGYWWSRTTFENYETVAWLIRLGCEFSGIGKEAWHKGSGLSVRCVKD